MDYRFENKPSYTTLVAELDREDTIVAESTSLMSHSAGVSMETESSSDGLMSSVKNAVLTDETVFVNKFTAESDGQEVELTQKLPGDIEHIELDNEQYNIQSGSYIASSPDIDRGTSTGGLGSLLGGEGLFFIEAEGTGSLFIGSYGGINKVSVERGETVTIDSGHAVAWSENVELETRSIGGLKQGLLSGEGLVMDFTGPGVVYKQSRNYDDLIADIEQNITTQ
jgi:uncharacterized protein (TIGR00266 family)